VHPLDQYAAGLLVDLYDASETLRAQVSFDYVPGGNTFLSPATPPVPVPANWDVGPNPSYWDITSDATFANDDVHVALVSNVGVVPGPENMLRLLHYDGQSWVDVTTDVDTVNHRIGGRPDGLSPFVLAVPTVPPASATMSFRSISRCTRISPTRSTP
jgi:hypothetical protein